MEAVLDETPREFALPAASVLRPFPLSVLADDSRWLHAVDAVGRHGASPGLTGQTPLGAHSVVYSTGLRRLRARNHGHLDQSRDHRCRDHHLSWYVAVCGTGWSRSWQISTAQLDWYCEGPAVNPSADHHSAEVEMQKHGCQIPAAVRGSGTSHSGDPFVSPPPEERLSGGGQYCSCPRLH